jgi:hypothetical protein
LQELKQQKQLQGVRWRYTLLVGFAAFLPNATLCGVFVFGADEFIAQLFDLEQMIMQQFNISKHFTDAVLSGVSMFVASFLLSSLLIGASLYAINKASDGAYMSNYATAGLKYGFLSATVSGVVLWAGLSAQPYLEVARFIDMLPQAAADCLNPELIQQYVPVGITVLASVITALIIANDVSSAQRSVSKI